MNFFAIENVECNNGDGFGTTLYVSGCEHHCEGCFNPKTWNRNKGMQFTQETLSYLKSCLSRKIIKRLTISGGDPLSVYNRMEVVRVCQEIRREFPSLEIWVYTGYTIEQLKQQSPALYNELCKHADFIVDGRFDKTKRPTTKPFRGSDNQRIWNLKKDCEVIIE